MKGRDIVVVWAGKSRRGQIWCQTAYTIQLRAIDSGHSDWRRVGYVARRVYARSREDEQSQVR